MEECQNILFLHSDVFCISDIQENLYKSRQGNFDVFNYITQLKVFLDELDNYHPNHVCSCSISCSCGAITLVKIYRKHDYIVRFLKDLNEIFSHSKSQIMMMNLLHDTNRVFSIVIQ